MQSLDDRHALSQVLIALGDALTYEQRVEAPGAVRFERALPIAVFLTGLPEFTDMAGARTGATFARRFQTVTLGAIDDASMLTALQPFVSEGWEVAGDGSSGDGPGRMFMEPGAQRAIVKRACGEPFLFQLAGERAWYAGEGDVITAREVARGWQGAADEAEAHVQRILERLPQREREVLEAMAGLDPQDRTLTRIAQVRLCAPAFRAILKDNHPPCRRAGRTILSAGAGSSSGTIRATGVPLLVTTNEQPSPTARSTRPDSLCNSRCDRLTI